MKIAEKIARQVNDSFSEKLRIAVAKEFGINTKTHFAFLEISHTTTRADGEDFTQEQMDFLKAFEAGYLAAMKIVREHL